MVQIDDPRLVMNICSIRRRPWSSTAPGGQAHRCVEARARHSPERRGTTPRGINMRPRTSGLNSSISLIIVTINAGYTPSRWKPPP
jgi:hypothetical protein